MRYAHIRRCFGLGSANMAAVNKHCHLVLTPFLPQVVDNGNLVLV